MRSPGTSDYVLSARLGIEGFDRRAEGRARVGAVVSEARRIRRADDRVRRVRVRRVRGDRDGYIVEVTVRARGRVTAVDCGSAVLRAAIHAAGGVTAGWGAIEPILIGSAGEPGAVSRHTSWSERSAAALARVAAAPSLPPLAAVRAADATVIDLRS